MYLICDRDDRSVMYIGRSRNLYERLRRHFYSHKECAPPILRERALARVYVLPAWCLNEAESRLIALYPNAMNVVRLPNAPPF